jgi:hypothetical protein
MADTNPTWLQKHEKLILGIALLCTVLYIGNRVINYEASRADARNQAAQATLDAQKKANDLLAQQNQQAQAQYQTLLGQLNAQNARLTSEVVQLGQSLAARQKQDAALPLPDLATRWENLLGVSAGITATLDGLSVNPSTSVQTVQQLEQLPMVKQQLSDETSIASNQEKQLSAANGLVTDLNKQVSGLQLQNQDGQKACQTQIAQIKAAARKGKRNWFLRGLAAGATITAYVLLHV